MWSGGCFPHLLRIFSLNASLTCRLTSANYKSSRHICNKIKLRLSYIIFKTKPDRCHECYLIDKNKQWLKWQHEKAHGPAQCKECYLINNTNLCTRDTIGEHMDWVYSQNIEIIVNSLCTLCTCNWRQYDPHQCFFVLPTNKKQIHKSDTFFDKNNHRFFSMWGMLHVGQKKCWLLLTAWKSTWNRTM